jgi:hypothetical protein
MSATESYRFHQFLLRPAGSVATDALLAKQWTKADQWHSSTVDPRFWLEQGSDRDSYILIDKEGPVFFWKGILIQGTHQMEMHIQFPPLPADRVERHHIRHRIAAGMLVGLLWLEGMLFKTGVEEVYFDSPNPSLAEFCTHHMKFTQEGQRLRKRLSPPPEARKSLERRM